MAPTTAISGLNASEIKVTFQEQYNPKAKDALIVDKFKHITPKTPEIILLS